MIRLWGMQGARPSHRSEDVLTRAIAAELASTILRLRTDGPAFIQNRGITGAMSTCPEPSPKL
jgi:hypothetical protein